MENKNVRIVARVSKDEYEIIKRKAKEARLSMSEYIRQAALKQRMKNPLSEDYLLLCHKIDVLYNDPDCDCTVFRDEIIQILDLISEELGR